jgi:hypothetical protein
LATIDGERNGMDCFKHLFIETSEEIQKLFIDFLKHGGGAHTMPVMLFNARVE